MTVGTNALLEERGARTALVATEGFTDLARDRPPGPRRALPPLRGRPGAAGRRRSCASRRRERIGPDGVVERARRGRARAGRRRGGALDAEAVAICLLFSYRDPDARAARSPSACASALPGVHVSASHEVLPAVPRVRALLDDGRSTPTCRRCSRRYLGAPGRARRASAGLPEPAGDASRAAASRTPARPRAHGRLERALGPGRRRGRRRPAGPLSGDGNARRARHGRHLVRRLRGRGRRGVRRTESREIGGRAIAAADGRRPHGRRRRRLDRAGATPAARCASGRARRAPSPGPPATGAAAREPTVTDANLLLGYLDAGLAARRRRARSTRDAGRARGRRARPASSGSAELETAEGIVAGRQRGDGRARCAWSRSSAASTRASSRWCRSAAPGRCTPPRSPTSSGCGGCSCPRASGVLSALGLVASERRRDTARDACCSRGDELTAERSPRRSSGCASGRSARRSEARRAELAHLRAPLRGPGVRARRRRRRRRPSPDELRERVRPPRTRAATATATPDAELELVDRARGGARCRAPSRPRRRPRRPRSAARAGALRWRVAEARGAARRAGAGHEVDGPVRVRAARGDPGRAAGLARRGRRRRDGRAGARAMSRARPGHAPGAARRPARRLRRDGRGAGPLRALGRTSRSAATAPPRCSTPTGEMVMQAEHIPVHLGSMPDAVAAVLGRGARARATPGSSTTPTAAAPTCPTSR